MEVWGARSPGRKSVPRLVLRAGQYVPAWSSRRGNRSYSLSEAPPSHWPMLNTTNSAGFTGQMPMETFT